MHFVPLVFGGSGLCLWCSCCIVPFGILHFSIPPPFSPWEISPGPVPCFSIPSLSLWFCLVYLPIPRRSAERGAQFMLTEWLLEGGLWFPHLKAVGADGNDPDSTQRLRVEGAHPLPALPAAAPQPQPLPHAPSAPGICPRPPLLQGLIRGRVLRLTVRLPSYRPHLPAFDSPPATLQVPSAAFRTRKMRLSYYFLFLLIVSYIWLLLSSPPLLLLPHSLTVGASRLFMFTFLTLIRALFIHSAQFFCS